MAAPTVPPVMIGGVRNILVDFSMKHVSNVQVIITILLVLGITFPTVSYTHLTLPTILRV